MTDKLKHINYWKTTAIDDVETVDFLLAAKKYVQALFFTHLFIEKIIKAHWVKDNVENVPPKTHNLVYLHQNTNLNLGENDTDFLQQLNAYQIEGRYPDYLSSLHKTTQKEDAETIIIESKQLFKCLIEKLQ